MQDLYPGIEKMHIDNENMYRLIAQLWSVRLNKHVCSENGVIFPSFLINKLSLALSPSF